jgi:3-oxoacyl-[acyl-carrier-protein] synthase III
MVDTTDEWITSRVGIKTRHIAAPDEQVDEMAALAGEKALANAGLTAAEIDMGAVNAVVARDVIDSGNTSAASIPLALSKLVERREIPAGAPVLLFGFGGGLACAGQIIRCP